MKELTKRDVLEYTILGMLLNDDNEGTAWKDVDGYITPEMFMYEGHRKIFSAMQEIREKTTNISTDPFTVASYLKSRMKGEGETRLGLTRLAPYMIEIEKRYFKAVDIISGNPIEMNTLVDQLLKYNSDGTYL